MASTLLLHIFSVKKCVSKMSDPIGWPRRTRPLTSSTGVVVISGLLVVGLITGEPLGERVHVSLTE